MRRRIFALGLLSFALIAPGAGAATGDEAVYGLVNNCYGLRAVDAEPLLDVLSEAREGAAL